MPQINMQVALTNPYTLDKFDVIRRVQDVSEQGLVVLPEPQIFTGVFGTVASVQQKDLMRMTAEQLQSKSISIITRFALRGASEDAGQQDFQPDIVVWNGDSYLIIILDDYSNYALGFVRAVGVMMDINAIPEVTR
jgi:hypothetical protein